MQIIKIKRSSIRKNPNYNNDVHSPHHQYLGCEIFVYAEFYPKQSFNLQALLHAPVPKTDSRLTNYSLAFKDKGLLASATFFCRDEKDMTNLYKFIKKSSKEVSSYKHSINYNYQEINFLGGEKEWLYEYRKVKVKCSSCGHKCYPEEFLSDSVETYEDDYSFCDEICPECKKWNAFDFKYEFIGDALGLNRTIYGSL